MLEQEFHDLQLDLVLTKTVIRLCEICQRIVALAGLKIANRGCWPCEKH